MRGMWFICGGDSWQKMHGFFLNWTELFFIKQQKKTQAFVKLHKYTTLFLGTLKIFLGTMNRNLNNTSEISFKIAVHSKWGNGVEIPGFFEYFRNVPVGEAFPISQYISGSFLKILTYRNQCEYLDNS